MRRLAAALTDHLSIRLPFIALTVVLAAVPAIAAAQARVGVEVMRERATYHFDHPSSIDTPELVPHFFEQYYHLDNVWLNAAAAFRAGLDWESSIGLTPTQTALATDYDTFFNPGGVVWVAGTTGDARIRSWRFGQQARVWRGGPVQLVAGYRLRVDMADFLEGDKTIVRDGVLVSQEIVTTREYTNAQRHELFIGAELARPLTTGWRLAATGDVAPVAVHRLAVQLPDKYPGVNLVYRTTALTVQGHAELIRTGSRWPLTFGVRGGTTANYSDDQRVTRTWLGASVAFGRTW